MMWLLQKTFIVYKSIFTTRWTETIDQSSFGNIWLF